jgi:hypothetical protein
MLDIFGEEFFFYIRGWCMIQDTINDEKQVFGCVLDYLNHQSSNYLSLQRYTFFVERAVCKPRAIIMSEWGNGAAQVTDMPQRTKGRPYERHGESGPLLIIV